MAVFSFIRRNKLAAGRKFWDCCDAQEVDPHATQAAATVKTVEWNSNTGEGWEEHAIVYLSSAITLYFVSMEIWNLMAIGYANSCFDLWNVTDWTCYVLLLYCLFVGYKGPGSADAIWDTPPPPALAVAQLLLWAKVLYFMRAFEGTGVYILTIVHILRDIKSFLLIVSIIIIGFSFAFYVLFQMSDTFINDTHVMAYSNIAWSLVSTFNMGVMGDFDTEMFHLQENETILLVLFLTLVSMVTIVLLNLLIALMGSTYERATQQSSAASRYERACILLELEATMYESDRMNPNYFPKFLHVLREKQRRVPIDTSPLIVRPNSITGKDPSSEGRAALRLSTQLSELAARQEEHSLILQQLLSSAQVRQDRAD